MRDRLPHKDTVSESQIPLEVHPPHPLTSEQTPEETIARLRTLPQRAARLKEILDARRATYSR
jgi:hypothetical protein